MGPLSKYLHYAIVPSVSTTHGNPVWSWISFWWLFDSLTVIYSAWYSQENISLHSYRACLTTVHNVWPLYLYWPQEPTEVHPHKRRQLSMSRVNRWTWYKLLMTITDILLEGIIKYKSEIHQAQWYFCTLYVYIYIFHLHWKN